jgi:flagellar protein FliS
MVNAYSNNYLENQIKSASPEQLLIMFYDGAIRFTAQAIQAVDNKDIGKRNYSINKACAIISELNVTLDHKIGGKIASDLNLLYDFMLRELHQANSSNNVTKLKIVEKMLCDLRDTWKEAVELNRKSTASPKLQGNTHRSFSISM